MRKRLDFIIFAVVVLFLGAAAFLYFRSPPLNFDPAIGKAMLPPLKIPQFSLIDQNGKPFDRDKLLGHWTLATIGFTYCPDVCPLTLSQIAAFYKQTKMSPGKDNAPEFVFLSVDPFRDTQPELVEYMAYFNQEFIGLTGKPETIHELVDALGLYYAYSDPDSGRYYKGVLKRPDIEVYGVIHSSGLLFISPQARVVAVMAAPFQTDQIVSFLKKLRRYYGG